MAMALKDNNLSGAKPLRGARAEPRSAPTATRNDLFLTAERLFAAHGFPSISVRDIAAEAGAILAALNYYFGSKDNLLFEIFDIRSTELNRESSLMLAEIMARHGSRPSVRDVFRALFRRQITSDVLSMATGESLAHLTCLVGRGQAVRSRDAEGVDWYQAA